MRRDEQRGCEGQEQSHHFANARDAPCQQTGDKHDHHDVGALQHRCRASVGVTDGHDVGNLTPEQAQHAEHYQAPYRMRIDQDFANRIAVPHRYDDEEQRTRARCAHECDEQARDGVIRQEELGHRPGKPPKRCAYERRGDSPCAPSCNVAASCIRFFSFTR